MNKAQLIHQIQTKQSFLCVGLDTDIDKLPKHLPAGLEGILAFNQEIIAATKDYAVAYKINTAFYECHGKAGWEVMEKTLEAIPDECFTIADAKRGDIGNTSSMYAKAFFGSLAFDSVTVAPYMGADSVKPFLAYKNKWTILLALTSNSGSEDFEKMLLSNGRAVYEEVLEKSQLWGNDEQMMYVVGATQAAALTKIRKQVPNHFLLVPGVGAQGGSLEEVCEAGMTNEVGLLINSSRGIIYSDDTEDFAVSAAREAQKLQLQMAKIMKGKGVI
ncbi:MAG: orotidine-5'-phosphate decarboxylase [Cyclobacteriaceae bacterium]|nr:orotidine-5'-phosphate decarboxylase [Cyclobacteriaceae bacterium]MCH8515216.1 orotidine-5'-phosphate decarboxylase [Cyclobacteriaceae bacterium]